MPENSQHILEAAKSYHKPEELANDLLKILPQLQQEAKNDFIKFELRVVEETKNNLQIHLIIFYQKLVIHLKFLRSYPDPGCFQLECKNPLVDATAQRLFYLFPTFKHGLRDLVQRLIRDIARIERDDDKVDEDEYEDDDEDDDEDDEQNNEVLRDNDTQTDYPLVDFAKTQLPVGLKCNSYNQTTDAKRQKIRQSSSLFPFDVLSKICSFLPEYGWFRFASVNKQFNRVLFQGTENIPYPIGYLFTHIATLVQQKHHSKLEQILEQIAKLKLNTYVKAAWGMLSSFRPYWTLNPLLVAVNQYPLLFSKHLVAIESLMDNFLWCYKLALNCTSVPQVLRRGRAVSLYYAGVNLDNGMHDLFKNKSAAAAGTSIGGSCQRFNGGRKFWAQITHLHYWINETADNPNLEMITKTLKHFSNVSKGYLPPHAEEMVPAATDLLLAVIKFADKKNADTIDETVHALIGFAAAHSTLPVTYLAKKLVTKCILRSIPITIPPELLADERFLLQMIERKPEAFMRLPKEQRNKLHLAELAILGEVTTMTDLSADIPYEKYKTKPCAEMVKHLVQLQSNREFMLAVLKKHPMELPNITLRSGTLFFKEALLANPRIIANTEIGTTGLDRDYLHQLMDKMLSGNTIINYGCDWLQKVAAHIGAFDEETMLKILKLLEFPTETAIVAAANKLETDPSMQQKLIRCSPRYILGYCAEADVESLLSHKEQQELVKLALMNPKQLKYLPVELYFKFNSTIVEQVMQTPTIHFAALPSYARSDVDLCAAVLQTNIQLAGHICDTLLMDTQKVLQLLLKVPELLPQVIVLPKPTMFDVIKSYLTNAPYPSFKELTTFDWTFYFGLPSVIRRDERFQQALNVECYSFTEDTISAIENGLLVGKVEDDEKQQEHYEEMLRTIAKPFKCL